ncbi:MAG: hypothetical protein ABW123_30080 [Cystobacter sp.]
MSQVQVSDLNIRNWREEDLARKSGGPQNGLRERIQSGLQWLIFKRKRWMPEPLFDDPAVFGALLRRVEVMHGGEDAGEEHQGLLLGCAHGRRGERHPNATAGIVEQEWKFPKTALWQFLVDALEERLPCATLRLGCFSVLSQCGALRARAYLSSVE